MTIRDDKLEALRELILDQGEANRRELLKRGQEELEGWLKEQREKLEREEELILQDARRRAEDIRLRQVINAEREDSLETLRFQNRLISDAVSMLRDELTRLRERDDYPSILAGLAIEGMGAAGLDGSYRIRLSASDQDLGDRVVWLVKTHLPGADLVFDPEPAPITGGLWLSSEDRRKEVRLDWQSRSKEMADLVAERLLQLL
ncbi:vacuolar-type H+-ATPase subunit E [Thermanaerovibrio velox DSM 12556]|uniref:Vacuolar-type H+-ATPase subunit E n=1 Tax=Thermanaerovibrio velox DSM 12556 TaxID=926567 RepID=H0UNJ7_9BACT|nr:V-type ATP synthase subunit E family protein [Thermanaerovibrio velox]EHM10412.1 vacuolar-type H+-ATPase subunit E [Thermanaerovibrio velox DSM 12556]